MDAETRFGRVERSFARPFGDVVATAALYLALAAAFVGLLAAAEHWLTLPDGSSPLRFGAVASAVAFVVSCVKSSVVALRGRRDRVELRTLGLVRHSAEFGIKTLAWTDVERVEWLAARVDVFGVDGTYVSLPAWDVGVAEIASAIEDRRAAASWSDSDLHDTPVPSSGPHG